MGICFIVFFRCFEWRYKREGLPLAQVSTPAVIPIHCHTLIHVLGDRLLIWLSWSSSFLKASAAFIKSYCTSIRCINYGPPIPLIHLHLLWNIVPNAISLLLPLVNYATKINSTVSRFTAERTRDTRNYKQINARGRGGYTELKARDNKQQWIQFLLSVDHLLSVPLLSVNYLIVLLQSENWIQSWKGRSDLLGFL